MNKTIVVDDEADIVEEFVFALKSAGQDATGYVSASAAIEAIATDETIDVIVSDIRMPQMDGLAMLTAIRERFSNRPWLQAIFITGHANLDNSIGALKLSAADFLRKPVKRLELIKAVEKALRRAETAKDNLQKSSFSDSRILNLKTETMKLASLLQNFSASGRLASLRSDADLDAKTIKDFIKIRAVRASFFGQLKVSEAIWEMLLDLLLAELEQRPVPVSSVGLMAGIPATTVLRRLEELEQAGLVIRTSDKDDARRSLVELTPETSKKMRQCVSEIKYLFN